MNKVSIIIPIYYNEQNIKPLYDDIKEKFISKINFEYEIIMIDDGSKDNSWEEILKLMSIDDNIVPIKLSRNFGSHAAILCGLEKCSGDCAVVKAADLQEPTELLLEMYKKWNEGYNVVLATRKSREDKSFFSNLYYRITRKYILNNMPENGFDVYLIDRKVIDILTKLEERNSALTCQILWSGFKTAEVEYTRKARKIGKSKWTITKKIKLVTDTIFSFSSLPIALVSLIGLVSCVGGFVWSVVVLIEKFNNNIQVEGYATIFMFQLLSFGIVMLTLGLLGGYLWRTYDASRNRPVYIIEDNKKYDK